MTTELTHPVHPSVPELLAPTVQRAQAYAENAHAANTHRAYRADWAHFERWCRKQGFVSCPALPGTVALYITELAGDGYKTSTIQRRLVTIGRAHKVAGVDAPTQNEGVKAVWKGIRRELGTAQVGKAPILVADLRAMLAQLPDALIGVRDRALLLIGFAGAFRRSELVSLEVADVDFRSEGLTALLRRSKTDTEAEGRKVAIPFGRAVDLCPVTALAVWLEAAEIETGPLFRPVNRHGQLADRRLSAKAVALVVKRAAARVGLDVKSLAGHSLRAGLATSAAMAGASERAIMKQTGHKSLKVVRRYIREGELFRENAATLLF